jgi:YidC/Oxa1 family membrane protein insertase
MLDRNDGDFSYSDLAHIGRYFKIRSRFFQWILATLLFHLFLFMHPVAINAEVQYKGMDLIDVNVLIESKVKDSEKFSGLASMYSGTKIYVEKNDQWSEVKDKEIINFETSRIAIIGRYQVLLIDEFQSELVVNSGELSYHNASFFSKTENISARLFEKSSIGKDAASQGIDFRYIHLWLPLRTLAIIIETILIFLNNFHTLGWGMTIIIFSILYKLCLLPVTLARMKQQKTVQFYQTKMAGELEYIRSNYTGEQAHNLFMDTHRKNGITPYFTLRPFWFTLLPIPFLIAIFNALGEMVHFKSQSFLFITDLAYTDSCCSIGFWGHSNETVINILPVLMTIISFMSIGVKAEKLNGFMKNILLNYKIIILNLFFLFLFYPFPASMVLFWMLMNAWHVLSQKVLPN